jgi:hypothetical protein
MRNLVYIIIHIGLFVGIQAQQVKIAKLKYGGGGDWYANKTSLPNLINFCNQNI